MLAEDTDRKKIANSKPICWTKRVESVLLLQSCKLFFGPLPPRRHLLERPPVSGLSRSQLAGRARVESRVGDAIPAHPGSDAPAPQRRPSAPQSAGVLAGGFRPPRVVDIGPRSGQSVAATGSPVAQIPAFQLSLSRL